MKDNLLIGISGKKNSGKDAVGHIIKGLIIGKEPKRIVERLENKFFLGFESNILTKKYADKLKDMVCVLLSCTRADLEDETFKTTPLSKEWNVWRLKPERRQRVGSNHNKRKLFSTLGEAMKYYSFAHGLPMLKEVSFEEIQIAPVDLFNIIGTDCGREMIGPNTWVNASYRDYKTYIGYRPGHYTNKCGRCSTDFIGDKRAVRCEKCSIFYPNWLFTDVRFPNEGTAIQARGGFNIRIERSAENRGVKDRNWEEAQSETALDVYTHTMETLPDDEGNKFSWTMIPQEVAIDLWKRRKEIYLIYSDGTEGLCEDFEDIKSGDYEYAVEKPVEGMFNFEHVVYNNGTLLELVHNIRHILNIEDIL